MADDVQYYAHYDNPPEEVPWALFKKEGYRTTRYVKHLGKYVELDGSSDYISGHSSDSFGARRISPEQAAILEQDIPDVDPAVVAYRAPELLPLSGTQARAPMFQELRPEGDPMAEPPTRLIYGPLPWVGYEGTVMDAGVAARFAAGAAARTLAEFQAGFFGLTWGEYLADFDEYEEEDLPSPDQPFSFGDWVAETGYSPQDAAWEVAAWRIDEIIADGPEIVNSIESGGGSPGGNINVICGPIEALDYVASQVDPEVDGFTLERDDEAVQAALPRSLYVDEVDIATEIAERAHGGQVDELGESFIEHPEMVAALVQRLPAFQDADPSTQKVAVAAAWLHDVLEYTEETVDTLSAAGVSDRVVETVVALSRWTDISEDSYYANINNTPVAHLVKTAELASNLLPRRVSQLDPGTRERLAVKYARALDLLHIDQSVIEALHAADDPTTRHRPVWNRMDISMPSELRWLGAQCAYKKKASAKNQARNLNMVLAEDPIYGPASGYQVGFTAKSEDGWWPLIWVPRTDLADESNDRGPDETAPSESVVHRVVLEDRRDDRGRYYQEASLQPDGGVRVSGEDSGSGVEGFFGSGQEDYEWFYDVPPERVPTLLSALGASPTDDVLTVLAAYYKSHGSANMGALLKAEPVNAEFHSFTS